MGGIIHVVQLRFKPDVNKDQIDQAMAGLRSLKDKCVLPDTQEPYIKSVAAGADNSNAGLNNGFTHMMVAVFDTADHLEYYAKSDPAHHAVVGALVAIVEGMQVLDIDESVGPNHKALL